MRALPQMLDALHDAAAVRVLMTLPGVDELVANAIVAWNPPLLVWMEIGLLFIA